MNDDVECNARVTSHHKKLSIQRISRMRDRVFQCCHHVQAYVGPQGASAGPAAPPTSAHVFSFGSALQETRILTLPSQKNSRITASQQSGCTRHVERPLPHESKPASRGRAVLTILFTGLSH